MLTYFLYTAYRFATLRTRVLNLLDRLEGGEFYSPTLRRIFRDYHNVEIGLYTHGACFVPRAIDRFTTIGRYCSIAHGVRTFNHNHPMNFKSTHAFFFNPHFGKCPNFNVEITHLVIGNDVWIGANALILPNTRNIGNGAVIGAGAVINKDVPPYAIVVGNPARVVRFRFPPKVIDELVASKWWEKPIEQLNMGEFGRPFLQDSMEHVNDESLNLSSTEHA
jgi:virginiamycin A acetyltransferase